MAAGAEIKGITVAPAVEAARPILEATQRAFKEVLHARQARKGPAFQGVEGAGIGAKGLEVLLAKRGVP